jgi:hypothetical protein
MVPRGEHSVVLGMAVIPKQIPPLPLVGRRALTRSQIDRSTRRSSRSGGEVIRIAITAPLGWSCLLS